MIDARPKVVFLLKQPTWGGVEDVMLALCESFNKAGIRSELWFLRGAGSDELTAFSTVENKCLNPHRRGAGIQLAHDLLEMRQRIRRYRPDAIISAKEHANLVSMLVKLSLPRVERPKVLVTRHVSLSRDQAFRSDSKWFVPALYKFLFRHADALVAVSEGVADEMRSLLPPKARDRVRSISNPVITDDFDTRLTKAGPLALTGNPSLVAVGRLTRQKGMDVLLQALALAPEATLTIVGDGEDRQELERLSILLGLSGRVWFAGYMKNPLPIIRSADVLVLASRWEGFGNVIVEALASGTAVIATDCRHGPREILKGGEYGVLVPPDNAEELAQAINGISATSVATLGDAAISDIRRQYSADTSAKRYADLLGLGGAW